MRNTKCLGPYRGYQGTIEFSPEDHCFFGKIVGIPDLVLFDASSRDDLEASFQEAVDDYVDSAVSENRIAYPPTCASSSCATEIWRFPEGVAIHTIQRAAKRYNPNRVNSTHVERLTAQAV